MYPPTDFPPHPHRLLGIIALGKNRCESASRWDVLVYGTVKGYICWCNRLSFLDLGAISCHIACVSLGYRRKKSHSMERERCFLMVPLEMPVTVALSQ